MTYRKYVRLCFVVFLPLLLLGFVTFKFFVPYPDQTAIVTCEEQPPFSENCRYVGDFESSLYASIKAGRPSWVGLQIGERKSGGDIINLVEATGRMFDGANIVSARPFLGHGPEVRDYMQRMIGRSATVIWGGDQKATSIVSDQSATIFCNDITIEDAVGQFTGNCYGDGWGGLITFKVAGQEEDRLEKLRAKASEELRSLDRDYLLYRAITYPAFIYIFLLISGFIWLARKAVRFVANG